MNSPISALRSQLESILLVVDSPVAAEVLARVVEEETATVVTVLKQIAAEFDDRGSGMDLRETSEGVAAVHPP